MLTNFEDGYTLVTKYLRLRMAPLPSSLAARLVEDLHSLAVLGRIPNLMLFCMSQALPLCPFQSDPALGGWAWV